MPTKSDVRVSKSRKSKSSAQNKQRAVLSQREKREIFEEALASLAAEHDIPPELLYQRLQDDLRRKLGRPPVAVGEAPMRHDYETAARMVVTALQEAFPKAAIETEEGFAGRVHVKMVCSCFNDKSEREKQAMVWNVVDRLPEPAPQSVGFILAYGFDELP